MRKTFLFGTAVLSLIVTSFAIAKPPDLSNTEIDKRSDRLDAINEKLQQSMADKERANLLFEKAQLMFNTFGPIYLRTSTEALLKAIQISPQERYEDFLLEVYDLYWKDKDFSGDDQVSKDLSALQKKCEKTICLSWYNLGLSNMDNPEHYFKNAIKADPGFSPSYYWLASYYCKHKKKTESIDYFERYLQVVNENDPQEKDRIEMARYFIKEMKAGNIDYNSIIGKAMSE